MKHQNSLIFLVAMALLCTFPSCKKSNKFLDPKADRQKLEQYFSAATVGVVSTQEEFSYMLNQPISGNPSPEQLQKLISLSPSVPGNVNLYNGTKLVFRPEKPLKSDATYTVNIDLSSLDKQAYPKPITYDIKTIKQTLVTKLEGVYLENDGSKTVLIHAFTADRVDIENLKKCLSGTKLSSQIREKGGNHFEIEVTVPSAQSLPKEIVIDGNPISVAESNTIKLVDSGTTSMNIDYTYHDLTTNAIQVYFSKKVDPSQDLAGLVTNETGAKLNYAVNNNKLTVFLDDQNVINTDEQRSGLVKVKIHEGIKSIDNLSLAKALVFEASLDSGKPAVRFASDGKYFPSEGDMKIPIMTRALKRLRVMVIEIKQQNAVHFMAWNSFENEGMYDVRMFGRPIYDEYVDINQGHNDASGWTAYGIDLTERIKRNPGSIYRISLDFGPADCVLPCAQSFADNENLAPKMPDQSYFDKRDEYYNDYYYNEGEEYNWNQKDDPCKPAYYLHNDAPSNTFICSNYSIIAKKGDNNYHLAISKLLDLNNVSGVECTMHNLQGDIIATSKTDAQGFVQFQELPQEAVVVRIGSGSETTYLSLEENLSNSLSEFDISGDKGDNDAKFFVYTERDVWRPGDSIFLNLMINRGQTSLVAGMPIELSILNTDNLVIQKFMATYSPEKLIYNFITKTTPNAKTGTYRAVFKVGPSEIVKRLNVETIKPNATEIVYSFDKKSGDIINASSLSGTILSQYLNGQPLANAQVVAKARVTSMAKPFVDFGNYYFSRDKVYESNVYPIFEGLTDAKGAARFAADIPLKDFNNMVNVSIDSETSLPDGGTAKEGKRIKVSPFASYIGCKHILGKGWNGGHTSKEEIKFDLVNVTGAGKKVATPNQINWRIQKFNQSWWLNKYSYTRTADYQNDGYWSDVKNGTFKIVGLGKLSLPGGSVAKGTYRIIFTDGASEHESEEFFNVYYDMSDISQANPEKINIETPKIDYKTGEDVDVSLPHIPNAKVLISIERGNRVIEQSWHTMGNNPSAIKLKSNENWSPNVYIHATIMQAYKQEANDLPLRLYGIHHIYFQDTKGPLQPVTDVAAQFESNKSYTFHVSESAGRPMEYTYSLVDEGLLSLTGFDTPDPNMHFNGKYPLLVKTWDIYKYLISFFKGKFAGIISIGGDDAYHPDANAEVNRFKPVVVHKGSFKVPAGGKNTHTVTIPNYIGKLRLMIVACNESKFGNYEKSILVKNPLMIQSQLPRSLNVSDQLTIPVTAMRDDKSIANASITASMKGSGQNMSISQSVSFTSRDQVTNRLVLGKITQPGPVNLDINIAGGNKKMNESTNLFVNYPNSYETSSKTIVVKPGQKTTINVIPNGYSQVFKSNLSVSGAKFPNLQRYYDNLLDYPYGCLEQTTSAAFAQMYADKILLLTPEQKRIQANNLQGAVNRISNFMRPDGLFRYWDNDYYHPWADLHAGNFLIEMNRQNLLSSAQREILDRWLNAHSKKASNWSIGKELTINSVKYESFIQAFRLYLLAKANHSPKTALNKFATSYKDKNMSILWLLAGAYKYSGYDSKAKEYVAYAEGGSNAEDGYYYSWGSQSRNQALFVEVLSAMPELKSKREFYYNAMVDQLNKQNYVSTQEMGWAFIAAFKHHGESLSIAKKVNYVITGLDKTVTATHSSFESQVHNVAKSYWNKPITIENRGTGDVYVNQNDRFVSDQLVTAAAASNLKMTTTYTKANGSPADVSSLGEDIFINVTIKNPTSSMINDLALNAKVASGWELINPRLYSTEQDNGSNYDYQDFRDDRVYTFFRLNPGEQRTYTFRAKAAFMGDFYLPSITCEHMYNGSINVKSASGRVGVK